jgi:hypothetical protein
MLVSHTKQFIFTKTAKTAGTSVELYFEPWCMPEGQWEPLHERDEYESETGIIGYRGFDSSGKRWFNHMSAAKIRALLGEELWNSYFKFCVVRNPYDKLVSAYHHNERRRSEPWSRANYRYKLRMALRPKFGSNDIERFRSWISHGGGMFDSDKYLIDGKVCVDYFIRFESLLDGIRHVCDELGLPYEPERLPQLKAGMRPGKHGIADYYDAKTIETVKKRFAFEIETFGYELPET